MVTSFRSISIAPLPPWEPRTPEAPRAHRYDLGVLYADMDVARASMKPVDSFRALALRLEEGLTHEDFDLARPFMDDEDGLGFIAARRDVGVLHVDVDSALGAFVKSIDAVGVPALCRDDDVL